MEPENYQLDESDTVYVSFGTCEGGLSIADIEQMVDDLKTKPASQQARQFVHLRRLADELEEMRKRVSKQVEFMKTNVIPEAFEREKISNFTTDDGYRVVVTQKVFASCRSEYKDEAYQWLRDNGFEDIVTETVNAGTLSSLAKNLLQSDDPDTKELPEDFFNIGIRPQISVTKTTKKG